MKPQLTGEPAPGELIRKDRVDVMHPFSALHTSPHRNVVLIKKAEGALLTDSEGTEFLDGTAGLYCVNIGYGRREIAEVAASQIKRLSFCHTFGSFTNEPSIELAHRLLDLAPSNMRRVLFATGGSDANDAQIKLVRRYNNLLGRRRKKKIIARRNSYHGATIGAGSLTGVDAVHRTFDLPIPDVLHTLPADYHRRPAGFSDPEQYSRYLAGQLDRLIEAEGPETVAAFIAEPVTGGTGAVVPPAGYFTEIRKVLNRHDVLMIADEVITGFGRTGSWFASPELDIKPDLITVAKGITSGYFPMAACLISEKISSVLYGEREADGMFAHGHTASGHPVGSAIALANLDILEQEQLPQNAAIVGQHLLSRLKERFGSHELVGDIRGRGLLIAVELDKDKERRQPFDDPTSMAHRLIEACFQERLIVRGSPGKVLILLSPPLTITETDADEIVSRLERGLTRFVAAYKAGC